MTGRIGKYDIVRPIGKGAMGIVYLAHDTVLERDVALKVMVAQIADDPELKQRFEREAKAVAKMTHPNVVNVFDLGSHTDGSPFIAMELLKGKDLQKAIRQPAPMSLERKVAIIVQVLAGLAHAHQAGIVHRDIKPANIFLNDDGTVKIMDFGVARLTRASMTGTGNIVGTADYMSPEQVKGAKVDGRSDLFSVGCMLFELPAGRRPFHAENLMAIFYKITHDQAELRPPPRGPGVRRLLAHPEEGPREEPRRRATRPPTTSPIDLREYLKSSASARPRATPWSSFCRSRAERPRRRRRCPDDPLGRAREGDCSAAPWDAQDRRAGPRADRGPAGSIREARRCARFAGHRSGAAPTAVENPPVGSGSVGAQPPRPAPTSPANPALYVVLGGLLVASSSGS